MILAPFDFDHALLRKPGRSIVHGLRAGGVAPEYDSILAEHAGYAAALEQAGLQIDILEPDEAHPDSMFIEDPALVFAEGAILLCPGAPSRVSEAASLRGALAKRFGRIEALDEGHADGGDILIMPNIVMIGLSSRTDRAGAEALGRIVAGFGLPSRIVAPPRGALHLKTAATLIDETTVLTTPEGAESGLFAGLRHIVVDPDERGAANALRANDFLLVSRQYPRTAERLAGADFRLVEVDTRHVARLDGGLTCMSLRYKRGTGCPDPEIARSASF